MAANNGNLLALKLQELELRPDVSKLFDAETEWHKERTQFYQAMAITQERILGIVDRLDKRMNEELKHGATVCAKVGDAMEMLVARLEKGGILASENGGC